MYRQNAKGDLVPWSDTQPKFGGATTNAVPSHKHPRVTYIPDTLSSDSEEETPTSITIEDDGSDLVDSNEIDTMRCCGCPPTGGKDCGCLCHDTFTDCIEEIDEM
jgi:hypothetical protein